MVKAPGLLIAETVLPHYSGGDVGALARALKRSRVAVSRLINGHTRISVGVALRLEQLGHGAARDWLVHQVDYDLERNHG